MLDDPVLGLIQRQIVEAWRTSGEMFKPSGGKVNLRSYDGQPAAFAREVMGIRYWDASMYTLNALLEHRRVVIRAARKCSKTWSAGRLIVPYFMCTGPTVCVTTSSGWEHLRDALWSEINSAALEAKRPMPGEIGVMHWRIEPKWYAIGRSTNKPTNVLGFHAGVSPPGDDLEDLKELAETHRLLLVVDEASGVEPFVFEAMFGALSGPNTYMLVQGNPTLPAGSDHPYCKLFENGSGFHRIHMAAVEPAADETPYDKRFCPIPDWLIPADYIEQQRVLWGEGSAAWMSFVEGVFPTTSATRQIVPMHLLLANAERDLADGERHMGVDIARQGDDWNVAALNINGRLAAEHEWQSQDLMETAGVIVTLMNEWDVDGSNTHVDGVGIGAGVVDRLRQIGYYVDAVDYGAKAVGDWVELTGETGFLNRKSELHWVLRRCLEEGKACIPRKYSKTWEQAMWPTYEVDERASGTVIRMGERKDALRADHGRSPDNLDAFVLSFSRAGVLPAVRSARRWRGLRRTH